jgi:putative intracellular protease/amidase
LIKLGANYIDAEVVVDSLIITGAGPKAAEEFGKRIVDILK